MSDIKHLLPPSASTAERAIETVIAERTTGIEAPISQLWDVDTCPIELLPFMAWAFSVEVWDHAWSEKVKRDVIRHSVEVHRMKGTRQSVALALGALGFRIDIVEGWEDGGAPHTFRLEAYGDDVFDAGFQINAKLLDTVTRLIENVKPVRSQFTLRIGETFENQAYLRNASKASYVHRLDLAPATRAAEGDAMAYLRSAHRMRGVDVHEHKPASRLASGDAEIAARSGSRHRVTSRITHNFNVREGAAYAV